jgi:hypothetical protein
MSEIKIGLNSNLSLSENFFGFRSVEQKVFRAPVINGKCLIRKRNFKEKQKVDGE